MTAKHLIVLLVLAAGAATVALSQRGAAPTAEPAADTEVQCLAFSPDSRLLACSWPPVRHAITTGMTLGFAPFSASQNWPSFTTSMLSS